MKRGALITAGRAPWARLPRLSLIATLGLVATLGASPLNASASTTVNVPCGNIKLLETAVGTPGSTVNLAAGCTYQLTDTFIDRNGDRNELPTVTGSVTINGHDATLSGIRGGLGTCCGRILEVGVPVYGSPPGYLTLNSVTITGGLESSCGCGGGLAVWSGSTAVLNGSVVKNNFAAAGGGSGGGGVGGGIFNSGTLKLNGSQVLGNGSVGGGGIFSGGTLIIGNDSQVSGNQGTVGGGIFTDGGTIRIVDSDVIGNAATWDYQAPEGGGIAVYGGNGGSLTLSNATVSGNSVSGPDNAVGGGISVHYGISVVIDNTQIRNNTASAGGGPGLAADGGGLYNNGGKVSFIGGSVEFNAGTNTGGGTADGGGVFNASGTVTQTGTKVTFNSPDDWS